MDRQKERTMSPNRSAVRRLLMFAIVILLLVAGYVIGERIYLGRLISSGKLENRKLTLNDFEITDANAVYRLTVMSEKDGFVMELDRPVKTIKFDCEFEYDFYEFSACYRKAGEADFREDRKVWAKKEDNIYYLEFPTDTQRIRINVGVAPGVFIYINEIEINPPKAVSSRNLWTGGLFALAVFPRMLYALRETFRKEEQE